MMDNPTFYVLLENTTRPRKGMRPRKSDPKVIEGYTPKPFENRVGMRIVDPEELLSLRIPILQRSPDSLEGYQRVLRINDAHAIAYAMEEGVEIQNVQVSLDEEGTAYITDGQHRTAAAIIAHKPLDVYVKQRTYAQARALFENQKFQKPISRSHSVMIHTDRMSRYVQEALVDKRHPWHDMVHERSAIKLSPAAMHRLVTMYGCNIVGSLTPEGIESAQARFNEARADELAELIGAFGRDANGEFRRENKRVLFYKQAFLTALTQAAVMIFLRAKDIHPAEDKERWNRHMTTFNWVKFESLGGGKHMVEALLDHWNKKKTSRRVERVIYESTHGKKRPASR